MACCPRRKGRFPPRSSAPSAVKTDLNRRGRGGAPRKTDRKKGPHLNTDGHRKHEKSRKAERQDRERGRWWLASFCLFMFFGSRSGVGLWPSRRVGYSCTPSILITRMVLRLGIENGTHHGAKGTKQRGRKSTRRRNGAESRGADEESRLGRSPFVCSGCLLNWRGIPAAKGGTRKVKPL